MHVHAHHFLLHNFHIMIYNLNMFKKLAKIKYLPNNFEVIQDGDHVICAISGKKIP